MVSLESRHVLVINDSPEILELFTELLEEEGCRVTTDTFTMDLDDLFDTIQHLQPDLIVLDMIIGREDLGWQLTQLLKMSRATRAIPIVLCTGAVRQAQELAGHLNHMSIQVVLKPFEIERLLEAMRLACESQDICSGSHG